MKNRTCSWYANPQDIIRQSMSCEELENNSAFIYFLIDGDEVVYVGQTKKIHNRVLEHKKDKKFTRINWIQVIKNELDIVESYYILLLKPKYNKTMGNRSFFDVKSISSQFGLPLPSPPNNLPIKGTGIQIISPKLVYRHAQQKRVKSEVAKKWIRTCGANVQEFAQFVQWLKKRYFAVKLEAHGPDTVDEYVKLVKIRKQEDANVS